MQNIFTNMQKNGKFKIGQVSGIIQTEIHSGGGNTIGSA